MDKRAVSGTMLILLLVTILSIACNIQTGEASGTIYVRADGSVDPPTAPIYSSDNVTYILAGDIYDSIVVERDSIVVDGAGYAVEGPALESGISLSWRNNITIKNAEIKAFDNGIYFFRASNISIFGNNITNNKKGIYFSEGSGGCQSISGNTIIANDNGIHLEHCGAIISKNNIIANDNNGIYSDSGWSTITRNNITNNNYGIQLRVGGANIIGNSIAANNIGIHAFMGGGTISGNNITENGSGILLEFSNAISISQNNMTKNGDSIVLSESTSHNKITENNITNNNNGVMLNLNSESNEIAENNITDNSNNGVYLSGTMGFHPGGNIISRNIVNANNNGIYLQGVLFDNYIIENNITDNDCGVQVQLSIWDPSGPTYIYHNNFLNNTLQANVSDPFLVGGYPTWDNGYPSGGNYWSDYVDVDFYSGPNQDETGSDGIWDHPYIVNDDNKDRYPFLGPGGRPEKYVPVAVIVAPSEGYVNEVITFSGADSYDPDGGVIVSYQWNFGDGNVTTTTHPTIVHTYTSIGTYGATLVVVDDENQESDPATHEIRIKGPVEAIQELIETIKSWNLPSGTEKSLTVKLEEAVHLLNKGNENGAIHLLMEFINLVEAQTNKKKLTYEQSEYLISEAQGIISLIER